MIEKGLYAEFPRAEYEARLARIRREMEAAKLDALFVTMYDNLVYFAGFRTWLRISQHRPFTMLIPFDREPVLFLPPLEAGDGTAFSWVPDVRYWPDNGDYVSLWTSTFREFDLDHAAIGIELGADTQLGMSVNDFGRLQAGLTEITWRDAAPAIWQVRSIKSPREIERIRAAAAIVDASVGACWSALRTGVTQRDLARAIGVSMMGNLADQPRFLIVRTGEEGWYMGNPMTSDREVKPGDLVHLDIGCMYRDYQSDMIRSACLGEPAPIDRRRMSEAEQVAQAVRDAIKPGITIGELDTVRTRAISDLGAQPAWHGIGHCIGVSTHELPRIGPGEDEAIVLEPGMVFTVEPGLSYDGRIAVVEDMVVVTDSGYECLTHAPRALFVAPA